MKPTGYVTGPDSAGTEYEFVQTRNTIIIVGREFNVPMYDNQTDVLFQALTKAFEEIDELKASNTKLNDKINSLRKVK